LFLGGIAGAIIGWLLGFRRPMEARLEEELRKQLAHEQHELAASREKLSAAQSALAAADAGRVATEQRLNEQRAFHEEQMRTARAGQDKALADLRDSFKALSVEALKATHPDFVQLATQTLEKFQETAKGDLARRQENIATLLKPLEEQLRLYQSRLTQSETSQAGALGELRKHLETLHVHSQSLSQETLQLRRVLGSSQARGRWGEQTLRRVVETSGLSAHCDFVEQAHSGEGKPDLIIQLPGDRVIIIDAKVPELDFLDGWESTDADQRAQALASHAAKLKNTIRSLAGREYPSQFSNALDHVVLFLPAESLFSAALEADRDLILWAQNQRILLATPSSLIAILRAVSLSWLQYDQNRNARQIAETAEEFFNRVTKFTEHLVNLRGGLERATSAFNDAVGSYERMVRPSGERLLKLGASEENRPLPELLPITQALRLPAQGAETDKTSEVKSATMGE
jgi:DNA recombination protein RmuC